VSIPDLVTTDLGPLTLDAPASPVRAIDHATGRMWQWQGDGSALLSVTAAVRPTRVPDRHGADGILREFLWDITTSLLDFEQVPLALRAPGAPILSSALVTGTRGRVPERHVVGVATDVVGRAMLVQVAVRDDDDAQAFTEDVVRSLVVRTADHEPASPADAEPTDSCRWSWPSLAAWSSWPWWRSSWWSCSAPAPVTSSP